MFALSLAVALNCEDPYAAHIANQLADVEARLRARDVSAWSADLQAERARNLDRLHAYRLRSAFPRNTNHPGQCAPYFIDDGGRACAVGHLMIESGYAWLAEEIARDENNDLLPDIDNESLREWVARSGLTAAEHALIQPCYEPPSCGSSLGECSQTYACGCGCCTTIVADGTPCGETTACGTPHCEHGACVRSTRDCDDGDDCTGDVCHETLGCVHTDECSGCLVAGPLVRPRSGDVWLLLFVAGAALLIRRR